MATLTLHATAVPASLANLNMSDVKKPTQQTPVQMRRNKLSKQLWEQVQLATALATRRQLRSHPCPHSQGQAHW